MVHLRDARRANGSVEMRTRIRSGVAFGLGAVALLVAGAAHAASVDVGTGSGRPGSDVTIAVTLDAMGAMVSGTQNRIDFDRETPIAPSRTGRPDCAANPAIDKNATGFRFQPLGCDPLIDCVSVSAVVLSFDNFDPIADGAVLYTCRIAIDPHAPIGTYALHNSNIHASAPNGQLIPTTGGDGSIAVTDVDDEPVASIDVGSASGPAGTETSVAVTLRLLTDPPAPIAGVMNDLSFDSHAPIAVAPNGALPDCRLNSDIAIDAESFSFLPQGCTAGSDCSGVHALVLARDNSPIADGATLYTCTVAIAADAPLGSYALHGEAPRASGPFGEVLPVTTSDGAVQVTQAPPPPCVGDCNLDNDVAINELLTGVNIAIGSQSLAACASMDSDESGTVAVNEIVRAVNNALTGCPL
jgi:hypothetical protein